MRNVRSLFVRFLIRIPGAGGRLCCCIAAVSVILLATNGLWASTPTSKPSVPEGFPGGGDTTGMMWQMLASVLGILVIGVLAILVIKKLLPRLAKSSGKRISVLETAHLGPNKHIHLLQVGLRKVLVASSRDGVVKLGDVTDAFAADYPHVARNVEAAASHANVAAFAPSIKDEQDGPPGERGTTK